MTANRTARLLVHGRSPGAWNMAVDQLLLDQASSEGIPTLRFYQWDTATLSLGYFQSYQEREAHLASRGTPVVRRLTGGGALVHDHELTYALALPESHPLARDHQRLYEIVHAWFLTMLAGFDIPARLVGCRAEGADCESVASSSFLCFERRSRFDVVADAQHGSVSGKIVGSAQRRRRGAMLQHGALLLAASEAAPELPGVAELQGRTIPPEEALERLTELAAVDLDISMTPESLVEAETRQVADISAKYASGSWLRRR